MIKLRSLPPFVLPLVLLSGCSDGTGPCEDICTLFTRIDGDVRTATGLGVPGAIVTLFPMFFSPCTLEGGNGRFGRVEVETDERGRFSAVVSGPSLVGPRCVEITVTPPVGTPLTEVTDTVLASFTISKPPTTTVVIVLAPAS